MSGMKFDTSFLRAAIVFLLSGFVIIQILRNDSPVVNAHPFLQTTYKIYLPAVIKPATVSRYIKPPINLPATLDPVKFYNMGYYSYTAQTGVVLFSLGQPCSYLSGGVTIYGATAYRTGCRGTPEIKTAIQEFIRGYCTSPHVCNTYSATPKLTLAIGVTNCSNGGNECANPSQSTNVTYAHGQAWSQLIADLISYTNDQGYSYQVFIAGALDAEPAWNTDTNTRAWADGYKQDNYRHLYNFGTCDGCPLDYTPNPVLPNGWTYDDIWYVSYGGAVTFYPLPEIYRTDGTNAEQWQAVSYYAATVKTGKLIFKGTLSQNQACLDTTYSGCVALGTHNVPWVAWSQLWNALYADPTTRLTSLPWQTDISWQQP